MKQKRISNILKFADNVIVEDSKSNTKYRKNKKIKLQKPNKKQKGVNNTRKNKLTNGTKNGSKNKNEMMFYFQDKCININYITLFKNNYFSEIQNEML